MTEGVLVIAHGSRKREWVRKVDEAVAAVDVPLPLETCFLEAVKGRTITDGIVMLAAQGVQQIIAVPLFVSSGSTHIAEIASLLGVNKLPAHPPLALPLGVEIQLCPPMGADSLIVQIALARAQELSEHPARETVVLVAHGSDIPQHIALWDEMMQQFIQQLSRQSEFAYITYAYLYDQALGKRLRAHAADPSIIVIPLFLSEGYFTEQVIPKQITQSGINAKYNGQTYLPHSFVGKWIKMSVKREWMQ